jgi:hypothetical protein
MSDDTISLECNIPNYFAVWAFFYRQDVRQLGIIVSIIAGG